MGGLFVVMGVSGCGKSSVGRAVAAELGATFIDGDDLHPAANIARMRRGEPLRDADRWPWLQAVGETLAAADRPTIIACSALKRQYRDHIRRAARSDVTFLHLAGTHGVIAARMTNRNAHFMPVSLLDSQFATLEPPGPGETAVSVDIDQPFDDVIAALIAGIQSTTS